LQALFVGNPVAERIDAHVYAPLSIPTDRPVISLFPGSRRKEIERNLPLMLQTAHLIKRDHPNVHFALCLAAPEFLPLIQSIQEKHGPLDLQHIPSVHAYELMKASYLAIAKSGTVTLELALHHVPTLVIYAISPLDQFIAYHLLRIRLPFYCLVNIIAGTQVFPELIGASLTPSLLKAQVDLLFDPVSRERIQTQCISIHQLLSGKHPSEEAARQILKL
jgi:lipid-A-disaccharide synthase